jgi:hypothetical protein
LTGARHHDSGRTVDTTAKERICPACGTEGDLEVPPPQSWPCLSRQVPILRRNGRRGRHLAAISSIAGDSGRRSSVFQQNTGTAPRLRGSELLRVAPSCSEFRASFLRLLAKHWHSSNDCRGFRASLLRLSLAALQRSGVFQQNSGSAPALQRLSAKLWQRSSAPALQRASLLRLSLAALQRSSVFQQNSGTAPARLSLAALQRSSVFRQNSGSAPALRRLSAILWHRSRRSRRSRQSWPCLSRQVPILRRNGRRGHHLAAISSIAGDSGRRSSVFQQNTGTAPRLRGSELLRVPGVVPPSLSKTLAQLQRLPGIPGVAPPTFSGSAPALRRLSAKLWQRSSAPASFSKTLAPLQRLSAKLWHRSSAPALQRASLLRLSLAALQRSSVFQQNSGTAPARLSLAALQRSSVFRQNSGSAPALRRLSAKLWQRSSAPASFSKTLAPLQRKTLAPLQRSSVTAPRASLAAIVVRARVSHWSRPLYYAPAPAACGGRAFRVPRTTSGTAIALTTTTDSQMAPGHSFWTTK